MLLLKGKSGKSVILEHLYKTTNSLAFVFYEQPVIDGALWIGMKSVQFDHFIRQIPEYLDKNERGNRYDYLIIYTNESEDSIKGNIRLIESLEREFGFTVIMSCL